MYANAVKHSKQSPLYIKLAMMLHKTYIDQSWVDLCVHGKSGALTELNIVNIIDHDQKPKEQIEDLCKPQDADHHSLNTGSQT